jgi:predicted AlkP superfamily pyrophosphatase or phosphodiesterase
MKAKIFLSTLLLATSITYASTQPRLIVQIVIDQLRGDLIHQYEHEFGDSGFKYLLGHGLDFQNAHHPHANTTTCAGHSTIATGSYPALHGIVDNDWYDRKSNKLVYCMEDPNALPLPTEHTKVTIAGRSPNNLKASTISDEIILARKGKAFGVSLKDRAAIALAGHAGKAFWFDKTNGGFMTTIYYYTAYPQWVQKWNNNYHPQDYTWNLSGAKEKYQNANTPIFPQHIKVFGKTFPHKIADAPSEQYFKFLSKTPKADQLTADFAELLLTEEQLGKNPNKTDYLGVSFSAVDAIGHQFGSSSLEAEDNLLMLDKTLAHLLKTIDQQVGLDNTLIVLSADHGGGDNPAYLTQNHIAEIKPLNEQDASKKVVNLLKQQYNLPAETLMSITPPYVYLNHQIISAHKLDVSTVSRTVAELLNHQPGVFKSYTLPVTNVEKDWVSAKVNRMAYPYRSGDVYLVPPPYQTKGSNSDDRVTHGSPWQYDSYVPLLFVNARFKPQQITRPVFTTDIASTLSALLRIKAPSAAVGKPLPEVINAVNHRE